MDFDKYFQKGVRYTLISTDDDYAYDVIAEFISWGIRNNRKCYYFVDRDVLTSLDFYLRQANMDMIELIASNKLIVQSSQLFFANNNINSAYQNIKDMAKDAVMDGYDGIAIISDREAFCHSDYDEEFLYNYEKELNDIFEKYPVSAISCYNIDKFGVDALFAITHLNPNFIYKNNDEVYVHINDEGFFTKEETLGIVQEFLKKREKVIRENKVYKFISKLSGELSYKKDEGEILETALNIICSSISANRGFVVLFENNDLPKDFNSDYIISYNITEDLINTYKSQLESGIYNPKATFSKFNCLVYHIKHVAGPIKQIMEKNNILSFIIIPIKFDDDILGCMWLSSQDKYFSFEDSSEFLYMVCQTIGKMLVEFRRYKKIQDSLIQSRKMQALGELTGGIAHEFNNILTPILGYIQILKNNIDDPILNRYIELIEESAKDGAKIVKRIQEFSKPKHKEKELCDINRIIIQSVEITKPKWTYESQISKKSIEVKLDLKAKGFVEGTATELREVFVNIISNAIDAMPNGGFLHIESFNKKGNIVIKIKDTGVGMTEEVKEKIFEPFFTTKNERGNGLGLSIVYSIIKEMSGHIDVSSQVNEGTEFEIKLPAKGAGLSKEYLNEGFEEKQIYKILVIDDQEPVAEAVSEMLRSLGHDSTYVVDDEEALKLIEKYDFDAVMCDLAMPNCTGAELSEKVKQKKDIPVVLMTGWLGNLNDSDKKYIDDIIQKPFSIEELKDTIQRICKNKVGN
ncbi:ATP-binding protein [Caloramator proteoclasticus]|uniref:Stage 0 sporulation protein A homolog n=1 Tax=Caloramator proteoclasticus DSM 10124 TaxID=1121262 RepID=A0A1M5A5B9_9CLOT|nr:ATP-binding protein [Caloramator proteoclasticus]SHF25385.1 Signal transduction histidine kinase [Caloramator proteoclasticus DSM 10124]